MSNTTNIKIDFYKKPVPYKDDMCDNASEMLVRANPKLSTNVKVMANGKFVRLESFDACKEISSSDYKNIKTYSKSFYNQDVSKFWKNTSTVYAYSVLQEFDNITVKDKFEQQYETFYWSGCEYIDSLEYDEAYGILAPLWLNDKIPDKFVIFKVKEPSYWNFAQNNGINPTDFNFITDILDKCEIIKTFDLTENSLLGSYIRKYYNQSGFPDSPVTLTDEWLSFNGISYSTGEFTSVKEYYAERFWQHDDTVIEFDKYITEGFERNGVIVANIMNIEFLFDDFDAENYKFNRYFGLYCDTIEDGKFKIRKNDLYNKGNTYSFNISDYDIYNDYEFTVENQNGVNVPAKIENADILPVHDIVSNVNGVFYIEDINKQLHSINRINDSGYNDINDLAFRLVETKTDFSIFKGFVEMTETITCEYENTVTPSSLSCEILGQIPTYTKIQLCNDTLSNSLNHVIIELVSVPVINSTNPDDNINCGEWSYDMFCGQGTNNEIAKAVCGAFNTVNDEDITAYCCENMIYFISQNVSPAYNNYYIKIENCQNPDNCVKLSNNGFLHGSNRYEHVKCDEFNVNAFSVGNYLPSRSHNGYAKIESIVLDFDNALINGTDISFPNGKYYDILLDSPGVYVNRTNTTKIYEEFKPSFGRLSFYPVKDLEMSQYHNVTKYGDMGELNYEKKILENPETYTEYIEMLNADNNGIPYIPIIIDGITYYIYFSSNDISINNTIADSIGNLIQNASYTIQDVEGEFEVTISNIILDNDNYVPTTEQNTVDYKKSFAFDTLSTSLNVPGLTYLTSEYARCYENLNPEFMLISKTQPWICNWVLKNGLDVREKPYRLNNNPVFGQYSFCPDLTNYNPNPVYYNQEYCYIMDKPIIHNIQDANNVSFANQRNIWSYIGDDLFSFGLSDKDDFENKLRDIEENWFDVFFKRDHINISIENHYQQSIVSEFFSTPDYMRKYSILYNGSDNTSAETFFRGSKIEFLLKSDWTEEIDNNLENLKITYGNDLNGYKFTVVCVPISINDGSVISNIKNHVIRNDKFKCITFIIYVIKKYNDALQYYFHECGYQFFDGTNPPVEIIPEYFESDSVNRYMMYNYINADETNNMKPITAKGAGSIKIEQDLNADTTGCTFTITGTDTSFLSDFNIYNNDTIYIDSSNDEHPYYKELLVFLNNNFSCILIRITEVISDTLMIGKYRNSDYNSTADYHADSNNPCDIFNYLSNVYVNGININFKDNYYYNSINNFNTFDSDHYYIINCNYNWFNKNFEKTVFASIYESVNTNQNKNITYELVESDGTLITSDTDNPDDAKYPYALKFIDPMNNAKYEYMSLLFDGEYMNYGILPNYVAPMYRYTGRFTPLRNDVLYYTDPYIEEFCYNPQTPDQIKEKLFTESRHMNTCFDSENISDFGIIHDLAFHRTNDTNNNVFKLPLNQKPIYPVSNKFAIGSRDVQTFNSSWDPWYFTKTMSNILEQECHGTLSMKENKSFFGSKCLSVPDEFIFDTFDYNTDSNDKLSDIIVNTNNLTVSILVRIEKKLTDKLREELENLFNEYVDKTYSYGDKSTLEDDIDEYIKLNLLKLYQLSDIKLWIKAETTASKSYADFSGLQMDYAAKISNGLDESRVMGISVIEGNRFDKKLIMNMKSGTKYTIGLRMIITKR